jgi:hypothetical protein
MTEQKQYSGHMTTIDGRHVPITAEQAQSMWEASDRSQRERAERLPDSVACLSAICSADQRLRELGWKKATYCPRDGTEFAVCQPGSTGMWKGFWTDDSDKNPLSPGYVHAADCVTRPAEVYFKPLDKLTDTEAALVNKCDADVAAFIDRLGAVFGDEP